jgi:hypothetical protein
MSTETTFTRRWKRPSPAFSLVLAITVVGLVISFALPSLVLPKFANEPTTLVFQVRVIDDQGVPIPAVNVFVGNASGQTDLDGYAEVKQKFLAKGIKGLTGTCQLEGEIRAEAPGYIGWKRSLHKLIGRTYNYVDKGSTVPCEVILHR